jgi:hypothetical protein
MLKLEVVGIDRVVIRGSRIITFLTGKEEACKGQVKQRTLHKELIIGGIKLFRASKEHALHWHFQASSQQFSIPGAAIK